MADLQNGSIEVSLGDTAVCDSPPSVVCHSYSSHGSRSTFARWDNRSPIRSSRNWSVLQTPPQFPRTGSPLASSSAGHSAAGQLAIAQQQLPLTPRRQSFPRSSWSATGYARPAGVEVVRSTSSRAVSPPAESTVATISGLSTSMSASSIMMVAPPVPQRQAPGGRSCSPLAGASRVGRAVSHCLAGSASGSSPVAPNRAQDTCNFHSMHGGSMQVRNGTALKSSQSVSVLTRMASAPGFSMTLLSGAPLTGQRRDTSPIGSSGPAASSLHTRERPVLSFGQPVPPKPLRRLPRCGSVALPLRTGTATASAASTPATAVPPPVLASSGSSQLLAPFRSGGSVELPRANGSLRRTVSPEVRWRPGWAENALIRNNSIEVLVSDHQGKDAVAREAEVQPQEVAPAPLRAVPEGTCAQEEPLVETDPKAAFGARFFVASFKQFSLPLLPCAVSDVLPQATASDVLRSALEPVVAEELTGEFDHSTLQVEAAPMMPPRELNAAELDDLFQGLDDNVPANGEMQAESRTELEVESSVGGWTSDGDDDVGTEATPAPTAPYSALAGGSTVVGVMVSGRRPPLRFRAGVPRLRLPPPGVGTVGGIDEAMKGSSDAIGGAAPGEETLPKNASAPQGQPQTQPLGHSAIAGSLAQPAATGQPLSLAQAQAQAQPLGQAASVGTLAPLGALQRSAFLSRSRSEVSLHRNVQGH